MSEREEVESLARVALDAIKAWANRPLIEQVGEPDPDASLAAAFATAALSWFRARQTVETAEVVVRLPSDVAEDWSSAEDAAYDRPDESEREEGE